jgi:RNA-binding protein
MLRGKQKRFLRALGTGIDPVVQIGKGGIGTNIIKQIDEALEARELIKIKVLDNSGYEIKNAADDILDFVDAELVQIIGKNILLYRQSKEKSKIDLPE